jgi:hypothetical protein
MVKSVSKSKRARPPSGKKKVKKSLKESGAAKRSREINPLPGPPFTLAKQTRAKAGKRVVDPLPGDDPFEL